MLEIAIMIEGQHGLTLAALAEDRPAGRRVGIHRLVSVRPLYQCEPA